MSDLDHIIDTRSNQIQKLTEERDALKVENEILAKKTMEYAISPNWKALAEKMAMSFKKVWDWYESGDTSDSGLGHALAEGREAFQAFEKEKA